MEFLTVQEVAKLFKVRPKRIYECLEEGKFPNAVKPLGGWLIPRADVDKLLAPKDAVAVPARRVISKGVS